MYFQYTLSSVLVLTTFSHHIGLSPKSQNNQFHGPSRKHWAAKIVQRAKLFSTCLKTCQNVSHLIFFNQQGLQYVKMEMERVKHGFFHLHVLKIFCTFLKNKTVLMIFSVFSLSTVIHTLQLKQNVCYIDFVICLCQKFNKLQQNILIKQFRSELNDSTLKNWQKKGYLNAGQQYTFESQMVFLKHLKPERRAQRKNILLNQHVLYTCNLQKKRSVFL